MLKLGFAEFILKGASEMSDDKREHLRRMWSAPGGSINVISNMEAELAEQLDLETVISRF